MYLVDEGLQSGKKKLQFVLDVFKHLCCNISFQKVILLPILLLRIYISFLSITYFPCALLITNSVLSEQCSMSTRFEIETLCKMVQLSYQMSENSFCENFLTVTILPMNELKHLLMVIL